MRSDAPGLAAPPGAAARPAAAPAAAGPFATAPAATAVPPAATPPGASTPGAPGEELGKLRWRCRRGMKELDILLVRYLDQRFCAASRPEQGRFWQLLEIPDPLLYAYCLGSKPPPPRFAALIERITANSSIER